MPDDDALSLAFGAANVPGSWDDWAPPGGTRDYGLPPGAPRYPPGDPRDVEPPPPPGLRYGAPERITLPGATRGISPPRDQGRDFPNAAPGSLTPRPGTPGGGPNTTVVPKDTDVPATPGRVKPKKGEAGDIRPTFDPTIAGTRPAGVRGDRGAPPPNPLAPGAGPGTPAAGGNAQMNQILQMIFQLLQRRMQGGGGMPGMPGQGFPGGGIGMPGMGGGPFSTAQGRNAFRHGMNQYRTNLASRGMFPGLSSNTGQVTRWMDDVAQEATDKHMHNQLQDYLQYQNYARGEANDFWSAVSGILTQLIRGEKPASTYSPPPPTTTSTTPTGPAASTPASPAFYTATPGVSPGG